MKGKKTVKKLNYQEAVRYLSELVVMESWIECEHCNEVSSCMGDEYEAAEEFYNQGWRVDKDGYAIGPKCARKK